MSALERAGLALLRRVDPERAHGLALAALRAGLAAAPGRLTSDRLRCRVAGLDLPNPLGLAAGFDKNATALAGLARAGFGFVEVGATTPRPQPGNPQPRLFRLTEDRAAINRFGFNNEGMEAMAARLASRPRGMVLGLNLGANKDTEDKAADYVAGLQRLAGRASYFTVNISSPNTPGLRALQGREQLDDLLGRIDAARPAVAAAIDDNNMAMCRL